MEQELLTELVKVKSVEILNHMLIDSANYDTFNQEFWVDMRLDYQRLNLPQKFKGRVLRLSLKVF